MEIKIIDGVEYYTFKSGRYYPVEMTKKLISDYSEKIKKGQINNIDLTHIDNYNINLT